MSKIRIFEKIKDRLFAACFGPDGPELEARDELEKAFDLWADIKLLRGFFSKYRMDLSQFDPSMKINDAVKQAREESFGIHDRLRELSEQDTFEDLFKPLDDKEELLPRYELQKLKAKEGRRKSILRLYAIKFGDKYVITGGTIKLTPTMKGRPHLKAELNKLELVKKLLQEDNPEGSFVYLDINIK
jgi:hypothetical protein